MKHRQKKKLDKDTDPVEFLRLIRLRDKDCKSCLNCPHHNGECVDWARKGKCKAY